MIHLISHFYNEEYLLPFWIEWHRRLPIDSVTMIDYASTDRSAQIIKEMAPEWRIIQSRNAEFNAAMADEEVMDIEKGLIGWKMALNVTEFMMFSGSLSGNLESLNSECISCPCYSVVGGDNQNPNNFEEFSLGFRYTSFESPRKTGGIKPCRYIHRSKCGEYTSGRHFTRIPGIVESKNIFIGWTGFYPWNSKTIGRKTQIKDRIPESDKANGFGAHHLMSENSMNETRNRMVVSRNDLNFSAGYREAFENTVGKI